jgi:hypothetical protein
LIVSQLVRKFPSINGTWRFFTVFRSTSYLAVPWADFHL